MEEGDPFDWILALCKPTSSQEAKLRNCPMARHSDYFPDSDPDQSSPAPTPSEPSEILMVSPPGSPDSVCDRVEDESIFHTPPEHHQLSSSEDQNLDEGRNGVRAFESGIGVEREPNRFRSVETVAVGETAIVEDTEIIVDLGKKEDIRTNGKGIEEIDEDEFRYNRPVQLKEKGKEKGLLEFLDVLKVIFGNTEDASEDEDFFAMIQRKGVTFPKPRWW